MLYQRHFVLLACFSAVIAVMGQRQMFSDPVLSFGFFGMLHACALVFSIRSNPPVAPRLAFVACAAAASALTLRLALLAWPIFERLPDNYGVFSLAGLAAASGALGYCILVRLFWFPRLSVGTLAAAALCCLAGTFLALFTKNAVPSFGGWWLAVFWWFSFSIPVLWSISWNAG